MAARMRIALLAVIGSMALVSLAYGAGGVVSGGSDSSGGSPEGTGAGPLPAVPLVDAGGQARHGPCRHSHGGGGSQGSHGSHGAGPSNGSTAAPPANSY